MLWPLDQSLWGAEATEFGQRRGYRPHALWRGWGDPSKHTDTPYAVQLQLTRSRTSPWPKQATGSEPRVCTAQWPVRGGESRHGRDREWGVTMSSALTHSKSRMDFQSRSCVTRPTYSLLFAQQWGISSPRGRAHLPGSTSGGRREVGRYLLRDKKGLSAPCPRHVPRSGTLQGTSCIISFLNFLL